MCIEGERYISNSPKKKKNSFKHTCVWPITVYIR